MNAPALPLQTNETALAGALAWLRARLQRLARREAVEPEPASFDSIPTLLLLQQRLGLSDFEAQVLLLCAAAALDTRIPALCAAAMDEPARPWPSFALALALFDDPGWEALSPHRPLRYWRLIEVHAAGPAPLTLCALRADDRIVDFLKGLNELDERVSQSLLPIAADDGGPLPPSQRRAADAAYDAVLQHTGGTAAPTLLLTGIDGASKRLVALHAAARFGLHLRRIGLGALPAHAAELDAWCRLWRRECRLLPFALYLDAGDLPPGESPEHGAVLLARVLDRLQELCFVDARDGAALGPGGRDGLVIIAVDKPTPAEQTAAWAQSLGAGRENLAGRVAGQFNLNLPQIRALAHEAGGGDDVPQLWAACRRGNQPKMEKLAQRLEAKAGWDDIVLPADATAMLEQLVAQVALRRKVYGDWGFERRTSRGLGSSALFHGESGTGKTLAAEVIATALQLDLYRIDLSSMISKYIGETEKNLQRVFDAAEDGGCILFFDEADALFGKRSEVRDSHDRYANIETNYLLQRIEAFRGLAILATNLKGALDSAFMRRLRFVVPFTFPGYQERLRMWQRAFPADTPTDGLDPARLARLDCTGGSIHSIALNAAFLAAHRGGPVTMATVLAAARGELLKLGRPINEADFRGATP